MNEQENIQNEIEIEEESKKKDVGKKVLKVLKFISLTIVKMVFVILTLASLIIAALGAILSVVKAFTAKEERKKANEIRSRSYISEEDAKNMKMHDDVADVDSVVGTIAGLLATGCFFLTKSLHGILREYLWPALGGLAICIIVIVLVEPDFYVEARNFVQQEILNNGKSSETATSPQSSTPTYSQPQTSTKNSTPTSSQTETKAKKEPAGLTKIGDLTWSSKADKEMNWNDAVAYCKNLNEGGYSDWRLPNIDELRTLIQNHPGTQSGGSCPISEKAGKLASSDWTEDCKGKVRNDRNFSKLGDTDWLWSSSAPSNSILAWGVNFYLGFVDTDAKYSTHYTYSVRCVRGSQNEANAQNPTTTSLQTETKAKKEPVENMTWSSKADKKMNWDDAVAYCKNLNEDGHNDWRLPNIDELRTLIQNHPGTQTGGSCPISEKAGKLAWNNRTADCDYSDGINFSKLGDTDRLWSSSVVSDYSDNAWDVGFDNGNVYNYSKSDTYYVRCVRNAD